MEPKVLVTTMGGSSGDHLQILHSRPGSPMEVGPCMLVPSSLVVLQMLALALYEPSPCSPEQVNSQLKFPTDSSSHQFSSLLTPARCFWRASSLAARAVLLADFHCVDLGHFFWTSWECSFPEGLRPPSSWLSRGFFAMTSSDCSSQVPRDRVSLVAFSPSARGLALSSLLPFKMLLKAQCWFSDPLCSSVLRAGHPPPNWTRPFHYVKPPFARVFDTGGIRYFPAAVIQLSSVCSLSVWLIMPVCCQPSSDSSPSGFINTRQKAVRCQLGELPHFFYNHDTLLRLGSELHSSVFSYGVFILYRRY